MAVYVCIYTKIRYSFYRAILFKILFLKHLEKTADLKK